MKIDNLQVSISVTREEMGKVASKDIVKIIKEIISKKGEVNMIFAAAPSQNDVLSELVLSDADWSKVNAFHMDEYLGLSSFAPQRFSNFLCEHIFNHLPFKSVNLIDCSNPSAEDECERYSNLLKQFPVDIVLLGIGENGHIAFNDPCVADFNDKVLVKQVVLDEVCRQQQVNDKCFDNISEVPKRALTLTIPALFRAKYMFCVVPAKTKAWAVKETLTGIIDEHCPASILRRHNHAVLYLDRDSASML